VQGEQVGTLWNILYSRYKIKIHFAHRTFSWSNEAKGNAGVHVIIIGFANFDVNNKSIFEYENVKAEPHEVKVKNINPYLVEGKDIWLLSVSLPINNVPKMQSGSAARDGGFLILTNEEKQELNNKYPDTKMIFRRFISGDDIINNVVRWCIWLKDANLSAIRNISEFKQRFEQVKKFREASTRGGTKKMADFPYLFAEERQPSSDFLLIPKVSSENRKYIPIAYLTRDFIISDKTFVVSNTTLYHFGVLTSLMHMTWTKNVCGRLESRISYSNTIVYNNYPWPQDLPKQKIQGVEKLAQQVLKVRERYPNSSLADLYDPLTMPSDLVRAHQDLDKFVDSCYRPLPFSSEAKRMEFLFELYEKYTADLFTKEKVKRVRKIQSK
jgi:hypothetical protein